MSYRKQFDLDQWREEIAVSVGNGEDIIDIAGNDFDRDVEHHLPEDPSTIGQTDGQTEDETESSVDEQSTSESQQRGASA